jgi:hypothetical protein
VSTSLLGAVYWVPGLFVMGIVVIIAVVAVAMKAMRRR